MKLKSRFLTLLLFAFSAVNTFAEGNQGLRPKLVVGIVVDQMRWDYLYRFYDEYTTRGFRRMLSEGYSFDNCQINYIPSVTSIGHTSAYTGSVPSIHGIAGNKFLLNGKLTYCTEDTTVQTVGSRSKAGLESPRNLLVTTIGDELKTATNWRSKVIGISFKDRAAILPAGHSADAAYWFDKKELCFITSTYYMSSLPSWVEDYNKEISRDVKKQKPVDTGKTLLAEPADIVQYSPYGNLIVKDMAKHAIAEERLGQRGETDMLCVSFSCTDIVGHAFGTHSELIHRMYVELDKQLADLFDYLDQTIGKGEYVAFLTADHGAANGILQNREHKIPSDGFYTNSEEEAVNKYLSGKYVGREHLVERIMDYKVVIDRNAAAGLDFDMLKADIADYFKKHPQVMYVVDLENISAASVPAYIREKIYNGYNRKRSGDIQLVLNPGVYGVGQEIGEGTTHGCWNPYDCHIPFVLMGRGVPHGSCPTEVHITDIAPTVCNLIKIQMPSGCIGTPRAMTVDR
ncbi:MAG: alkaline phosphatase family protein [Prevotella sp.]|uniref:alkaline phosphatase family protein n=1 Tax=Prevotella sp. TaxID=59823 RepID=UPI002A33D13B|nr:alkaline phosphatase family protein [Prevotella sp.]MDD7317599.1 alkaline phosphatase family protein [Prevotellaceae bacterium]MDY4020554.1 alkaline phosphatase family protein [Prevotella sp.]